MLEILIAIVAIVVGWKLHGTALAWGMRRNIEKINNILYEDDTIIIHAAQERKPDKK